MYRRAFRFFFIAFILWLILIAMIYLGTFLKFMLNGLWYEKATLIALLFVWVNIFTITVVVSMKGVVIIRDHLKAKMRLDFLAWLGMLAADYSRNNPAMDINTFFKNICEENGLKTIPDIKKFYDSSKNLNASRDIVFETIRADIEKTINEPVKQPVKK